RRRAHVFLGTALPIANLRPRPDRHGDRLESHRAGLEVYSFRGAAPRTVERMARHVASRGALPRPAARRVREDRTSTRLNSSHSPYPTLFRSLVDVPMSSSELLYRSRTCAPGRTATAIDLSPTALGWKYIHFAVRHLGPSSGWRGMSRHEERCLVLLRGAFE